jgi:hypothetical protein
MNHFSFSFIVKFQNNEGNLAVLPAVLFPKEKGGLSRPPFDLYSMLV